MEKKQKIAKSIICIITALLIAGCFIGMAFMPKMFATNSASADIMGNPPTENDAYNEKFINVMEWENATATPTQDQIYAESSASESISRITFKFETGSTKINLETLDMKIAYSGYRAGANIDARFYDDDEEVAKLVLENTLYSEKDFSKNNITFTNENKKTANTLKIYINPSTGTDKGWIRIYRFLITYEFMSGFKDSYIYSSYLYNVISSAKENSKEEGYNTGYDTGYNAGYQVGYDKGIVSEWESPITIFIQPIDSFLSTNIFGSISIGDVLSVILFVMVGIIFIKMFAGG